MLFLDNSLHSKLYTYDNTHTQHHTNEHTLYNTLTDTHNTISHRHYTWEEKFDNQVQVGNPGAISIFQCFQTFFYQNANFGTISHTHYKCINFKQTLIIVVCIMLSLHTPCKTNR